MVVQTRLAERIVHIWKIFRKQNWKVSGGGLDMKNKGYEYTKGQGDM